ncbi:MULTISPECIES: dTDP-4-dehydrorhamnose reductase [unclassified Paenibacillus]|uniref:dTDP-4-dehydrorhamnose reductase n=1 Tax=unclassified Paenibacillus TaxID=185978 RepID=UPI001AE9D447|nr:MULTISPECIES: dTDP-4-dehydrorhamnose reductase [unclassified Paenibacillus]MBP1157459.1 dTDP-4-dehydrorhamnose reductase [Paenibacillus sp. PvP091]MBP1171804.1 dTDP-4-dehydrorhamnose reductase [Paenibacillus sp. PvR098]MBP2438185.1 dTDP-4-dehydrorhamnose reductase [Paenibacillus sp. PvP052]
MRILVTGANGQLGKDLVKILGDIHEVYGYDRLALDITSPVQCKSVIGKVHPDVVIHAAAYTAVDLAETEEDEAYKINAFGTRNLTAAAEELGAKFCYISTDYVFDGTTSTPYKEFDQTNPQSVYGRSKRAGELLVQSLSSKYFIVRTSWVYGIHGTNFVKTMLNLSKERDTLKVVNDQIGSPTYTVDLSRFIAQLVETECYGIYHASNSGACSWYDFACAIFEESGISMILQPCSTEEFPRPAPRPKYSVMDHLSIRTNGFKDFRNWREALRNFLKELKG